MAARVTVARDGCVVSTAPLSPILRGFVRDWNRRRPPPTGQYGAESRGGVPRVSAAEWIEQETALLGARFTGNQLEKLTAARPSPPTVELRVADVLLTVIGRPDLLSEIPVRPNPRASRTAQARCARVNASIVRRDGLIRAACCGSSLTGSGR